MTSTDALIRVVVPGQHLLAALCGARDANLRTIEAAFPDAVIQVRGNEVVVRGADAERVGRIFEELVVLIERGKELDE